MCKYQILLDSDSGKQRPSISQPRPRRESFRGVTPGEDLSDCNRVADATPATCAGIRSRAPLPNADCAQTPAPRGCDEKPVRWPSDCIACVSSTVTSPALSAPARTFPSGHESSRAFRIPEDQRSPFDNRDKETSARYGLRDAKRRI